MKKMMLLAILLSVCLGIGNSVKAADIDLSIGTSSVGSGAHVAGSAFATFISKEVSGVSINVPTSKGQVWNMRAMESGQIDFMLSSTGILQLAKKGEQQFRKKHVHMRAFAPLFPVPLHVVTLQNTRIKKLEDLRGKRVNVAPRGGLTKWLADAVLDATGIARATPLDFMSFGAAGDALTDYRISAFFQPAPLPNGNITKVANVGGGVRLLPIDGRIRDESLKALVGYVPAVIPGGLYKGADQPTETIGHIAVYCVRDSVPEEVVYQISKSFYSWKGRDYLIKAHKAYKSTFELSPGFDIYAAGSLKLHPGLARFWKEQGVKIPANIMP